MLQHIYSLLNDKRQWVFQANFGILFVTLHVEYILFWTALAVRGITTEDRSSSIWTRQYSANSYAITSSMPRLQNYYNGGIRNALSIRIILYSKLTHLVLKFISCIQSQSSFYSFYVLTAKHETISV